MIFVVYHCKSGEMIKTFNAESSAKRSTTCMNRNAGSKEYWYCFEEWYWKEIRKSVMAVQI